MFSSAQYPIMSLGLEGFSSCALGGGGIPFNEVTAQPFFPHLGLARDDGVICLMV